MQKPSVTSALPDDRPQWGIQEFADLFNVTPRAVRFYEDKGLLNPSRESGARVFSHKDHARLSRILRAKRLGFTLDDIKTVMDVTDGVVTDRSMLAARRDSFHQVIADLKHRRKDIDVLTSELTDLCAIIDTHLESTEDVPMVTLMAQAYEEAFRDHFADERHLQPQQQEMKL